MAKSDKFAFLSTLPARGATNCAKLSLFSTYLFLSTLPARGATRQMLFIVRQCNISIHAPREGSDARLVLLPYSPQ